MERADACIEAEKDEPGVEYPGLLIVAGIPGLPTKELCFAVAAGRSGVGDAAPRFTVAAPRGNLHPLRATAGQNR